MMIGPVPVADTYCSRNVECVVQAVLTDMTEGTMAYVVRL